MTSASELPLSHDPPARHPSFLPLLCLSIPLDNLSLPLCIVLSFSSSSSFFVRLFSFSRLAPSGSRGASRRERERKGAPPPSAPPPPPPPSPPPTWPWYRSVGRGDRRARRRRKGARSGQATRGECQRGIISFFLSFFRGREGCGQRRGEWARGGEKRRKGRKRYGAKLRSCGRRVG